MKTIKVIDLLNKIANEKDVPKKIKYNNQIYELTDNKIDWYCYDYARNFLGNEIALQELNDEVEIIEDTPKEDNKIEDVYIEDLHIDKVFLLTIDDINTKINEIINKHNMLVDKVNGDK